MCNNAPTSNCLSEDERFLNLLAVFHFIVGGVTALFACFPLIHVGIGLAMIHGDWGCVAPPDFWMGWVFLIVGGVMFLCGWALAVAILVAGRKLQSRRSWLYCLVVDGFACVFFPIGTVLGVFTIIVLMRPSVKELFASRSAPGPSPT